MDTTIKTRWIEVLRGGRYRQGKKFLFYRRPGEESRFCCLGVLCDLLNTPYVEKSAHDCQASGVDLFESIFNHVTVRYYGKENPTSAHLPEEVRNATGLGMFPAVTVDSVRDLLEAYGAFDKNIFVLRNDKSVLLTTLNDAGFRFDEIANIIEKGELS